VPPPNAHENKGTGSAAGSSTFGRIERGTLWIGALCGIASALATVAFAVSDRLAAPDPARVTWESTVAPSPVMAVAPHVSKDRAMTDPFPVLFRLRNDGDQTARRVALRLIHPASVVFLARPALKVRRDRVATSEPLTVTTVSVGDIRPGEQALANDLVAVAENTVDVETKAKSADGVAVGLRLGLAVSYRIQSEVLSDDANAISSTFFLTVGPERSLRKAGGAYIRMRTADGRGKLICPARTDCVRATAPLRELSPTG
jgi:hypothetical protein